MPQNSKKIHPIDGKKPAKGIYVLPNLFTSAGLFAGFYAIMQARLGHFEAACLAIYVAMVMDIIDGRLARLTNTMSEFGSEYDSLSDMVSFGVAPAMVVYEFALSGLGKVGSLVAFIYIACAALRLARFNVQKLDDKKYFIGLPSPGAAAMVASVIWVCVDYGIVPDAVAVALAVIVALVAFSMVSNIHYRSFKDVDFRDKMPFIGLIVLVLLIAIIYLDPPFAFLVIGTIYLASGSLLYGIATYRKFRAHKQDTHQGAD
ncbi:MAG: CDP-diacylglycerol--serine O-phosphatidyltransferase [Arenicella sp.]|nr:CDP-diacylglycerol--serine O-phosphatidyltransferase [Arenicella sp.]